MQDEQKARDVKHPSHEKGREAHQAQAHAVQEDQGLAGGSCQEAVRCWRHLQPVSHPLQEC